MTPPCVCDGTRSCLVFIMPLIQTILGDGFTNARAHPFILFKFSDSEKPFASTRHGGRSDFHTAELNGMHPTNRNPKANPVATSLAIVFNVCALVTVQSTSKCVRVLKKQVWTSLFPTNEHFPVHMTLGTHPWLIFCELKNRSFVRAR